MTELSSNKKFFIIITVIVFFGLSWFGLAGWIIWNNSSEKVAPEPSNSVSEPRGSDGMPPEQEAIVRENEKRLYQECIDTANRLFNENSTKVPSHYTIEEYTLYRQGLTDLRDNQKADCDRQYKN